MGAACSRLDIVLVVRVYGNVGPAVAIPTYATSRSFQLCSYALSAALYIASPGSMASIVGASRGRGYICGFGKSHRWRSVVAIRAYLDCAIDGVAPHAFHPSTPAR